jgi:hypothetical protein
MHSFRRPLIACAIKLVRWQPANSDGHLRTVWEVCKWPQGASYEWCFICWELDGRKGIGAWWLTLPNKRAAMAFFRQPTTTLMQWRGDPTVQGVLAGSGSCTSPRK